MAFSLLLVVVDASCTVATRCCCFVNVNIDAVAVVKVTTTTEATTASTTATTTTATTAVKAAQYKG